VVEAEARPGDDLDVPPPRLLESAGHPHLRLGDVQLDEWPHAWVEAVQPLREDRGVPLQPRQAAPEACLIWHRQRQDRRVRDVRAEVLAERVQAVDARTARQQDSRVRPVEAELRQLEQALPDEQARSS